jgi:hypothetical protein
MDLLGDGHRPVRNVLRGEDFVMPEPERPQGFGAVLGDGDVGLARGEGVAEPAYGFKLVEKFAAGR